MQRTKAWLSKDTETSDRLFCFYFTPNGCEFLFRCEFFEKLDLNQFVQDPDDQLGHYTLHAVLVHSGKSSQCWLASYCGKKRKLKTNLLPVWYYYILLVGDSHCDFRMHPLTQHSDIAYMVRLNFPWSFNFKLNTSWPKVVHVYAPYGNKVSVKNQLSHVRSLVLGT